MLKIERDFYNENTVKVLSTIVDMTNKLETQII